MSTLHQRNPSVDSQATYLSAKLLMDMKLAGTTSPATQMLDQLEAHMSQETCYLGDTNATNPHKNLSNYPKFELLMDTISVSFENVELGMELVEMSIEIVERTGEVPLVCENAAIVKDSFKDLSIKPGDVICCHDANHRVMSYKEFVDMAKLSVRPLKISLKRFRDFPHEELILSDDEGIEEDKIQISRKDSQAISSPKDQNRSDGCKASEKRAGENCSINVGSIEEEDDDVVCLTCEGKWNKAHHILCQRSRFFEFDRKSLCFQSARSGCLACSSLISNGNNVCDIQSHSNRCSFKKAVVENRKKAQDENIQYGITCQICSDDCYDIIDIPTQHHILCIRNKKFNADQREIRYQGAKLGCEACKEILRHGVTKIHHSKSCPLNTTLTQNSIDTVETPHKSEYELLRQKNIERNNARLMMLGLISEKTGEKKAGEKLQNRKVTGSKRKEDKTRNGLNIGCEACLQRFRGTRIKTRHHRLCPLSRHSIQNKVEKIKKDEIEKPDLLSQPQNESVPRPVVISPLQNSVFIVPSSLSQSSNLDKSRWEPCGNPWGEFGQGDGDHILLFVDRICHDIDNDVNLRIPEGGIPQKRFVQEPLSNDSPYRETHSSRNEGSYSVLKLRRDIAASRPWGFFVSLHEFGGACIVKTVSPCSPAEAARDIAGFSSSYIVNKANNSITVPVGSYMSDGLRVNDIILCINGKSVGGMSMNDFIVELETCGPELILVVARCTKETDQLQMLTIESEDERLLWYNIGNGLDWYDLGNDKPVSRDSVEDQKSKFARHHERENEIPQNEITKRLCRDLNSVNKTDKEAIKGGKKRNESTVDDEPNPKHLNNKKTEFTDCAKNRDKSKDKKKFKKYDERLREIEDVNETVLSYLDEDAPWNGCVCGAIHPSPLVVFWIACDKCSAWFNVSPKCVGFDEGAASTLKEWICWECKPPVEVTRQLSPDKPSIASQDMKRNESEFCTPSKTMIGFGTVVEVAKRTWSGINKLGGVAKITGSTVKCDKNGSELIYYDVKYVLGGSERNVESKYIEVQDLTKVDSSPADSVGRRNSRTKE